MLDLTEDAARMHLGVLEAAEMRVQSKERLGSHMNWTPPPLWEGKMAPCRLLWDVSLFHSLMEQEPGWGEDLILLAMGHFHLDAGQAVLAGSKTWFTSEEGPVLNPTALPFLQRLEYSQDYLSWCPVRRVFYWVVAANTHQVLPESCRQMTDSWKLRL